MTSAKTTAGVAAGAVIAAAVDSVQGLTAETARIEAWAARIGQSLQRGGTVLTAGNGGSATHAAHLASELVGRFRDERPAQSAVCLSADGSVLTALGNDYGFEQIFARQVTALAGAGDVVIAFSTSGRSANLLEAVRAAHACDAVVLAVVGDASSPLAVVADDALAVRGTDTASIQDAHHVMVHALCAELDALEPQLDRSHAGRRVDHSGDRKVLAW